MIIYKAHGKIISFNKFHKKYLMRFHYVLNPMGLCIAFFHFLLSSCRSFPFPESGLLSMPLIAGFGLMTILRPCGKLQGIFDRQDFLSNLNIRSPTPQQAAGNALAVAVQGNSQADAKIRVSPARIVGDFFSIDSCTGHRSPDC